MTEDEINDFIKFQKDFLAANPEMGELAREVTAALHAQRDLKSYTIPPERWIRLERLFAKYAGGINWGSRECYRMHFLVRGIPIVMDAKT